MTVSSTSSRVIYLGNGSTTTFAFTFKVNQPADLVVVYTDITGIDYTLSPSQYMATGFGLDAGGSVTYPLPGGSPIATGTKLTIYRDVAVTQPTSLSNQGAMWPQVIEAALDRLTYVAQKVTDAVSRSLVISPTDSASLGVLPNAMTRANSVLAFDSQGQPYAGTLTGSLVSVASWLAQHFLPAATPLDACNAIGAPYLPGSNAYTGTNDFTGGPCPVPTRSAGDSGADAASTAFVATAIANARTSSFGAPVLRSYLAGLGLSNDATTPNTKIDVAAGICADSTSAQMLALPSGGTLSCATVGANGLDAGSLANNTWYHVHVIGKTDGTTALLACTTANLGSITMPTGYTMKRRIGAFRTDSSAQIIPFIQDGDQFYWKTPRLDMSATNPGTASFLQIFASVPPGLAMHMIFNLVYMIGSAGWPSGMLPHISDPGTVDMPPSPSSAPLTTTGSVNSAGGNGAPTKLTMRTDNQARLRFRAATSNGSDTIYVAVLGWIDRRGRDD